MRRAAWPRAALALALGAYVAGFGALAVRRHDAFSTGRFDLGNMVQAVWATAHGHPLAVTSADGRQFVRLGAHVDPILVLFAPLWRAWPDPRLLLVVQVVAIALGAVPLYWLAERHLRSSAAALGFALAYLLSPAVEWMTLADFHPVALATPLLVLSFWALDQDRLATFAVAAVLALATKEHVGLAIAGLGLWYAVAHGRRVAGAAIAGAGLAWSVLAVAVVIPHFSPSGRSPFTGRYEAVGGSIRGVLQTLVTQPWRLAEEAFDRRGLEYVLALLVPLGGLPVLAPLAAVGAVPEIALDLLSSVPTQTSIRYQYSAVALGVLFPAAVFGAARLIGRDPRRRAWVGGCVAALALAAGYVLGPIPLWRGLPGGDGLATAAVEVSPHDRLAARAVALVPADAIVSASSSLGGHLSARRRILGFPQVGDAAWVAVDSRQPGYADRAARRRAPAVLARLRRSPRWRVVFERDEIVVLRRRPAPTSP